MGMVFQSFGLLPHLNVIDNIAFPLKLQGIPEKERYAQAERVIELVGLQGRESNFPKELSGNLPFCILPFLQKVVVEVFIPKKDSILFLL